MKPLRCLQADCFQDYGTMENWMREEVMPALEEFDADPSSGFTSEQLRQYLVEARLSWRDGTDA